MAKQTFFCLFLSLTLCSAAAAAGGGGAGSVKLYVFGDSYVDTGNYPKTSSGSWKEPYGITFPGRPAGRFSDGLVLTDHIASFLGIPSPLPYEWRKFGKKLLAAFGMNFAYGGAGVFNTVVKAPNMTTQIGFFQQLLQDKIYTKHYLKKNSTIALVSVGGNDYGTYMASNGSLQDVPTFTESVINQLALNLKRLHGLGVQKVAVTTMEPLGCIPAITASISYKNCSKTENSISDFHNQRLQQTVKKLNKESSGAVFVIIDVHSAILSALKSMQQHHTGISGTENMLKPCCVGVDKGNSCGSVDKISGAKKYIICEKPLHSFFWDMIHPSHQGWDAVYSALKSSLDHLQLY